MQRRPVFPTYLEMPTRVPLALWHAFRAVSVLLACGLCILLVVRPAVGLRLMWGLVVPLLPLLFFGAPGLWRNLCPLAAVNQTPRLLGFSRGLSTPSWFTRYAYLIGIGLFIAIVVARPWLFNYGGTAAALLLFSMLVMAFLGGVVFKGKSGWCSSVCPLLSVQRIYGQSPWVTVRNSHCSPCVGCTKHCYDFNPTVAYLADLYDADPKYSGYRKVFAGALPGLILAYFTVPATAAAPLAVGGHFALVVLVSLGSFYALESFLRATANQITALYAASALNLFYIFTSAQLAAQAESLLGAPLPDWSVWLARACLAVISAAWVLRTYRKEPRFVEQAMASAPIRIASPAALQ